MLKKIITSSIIALFCLSLSLPTFAQNWQLPSFDQKSIQASGASKQFQDFIGFYNKSSAFAQEQLNKKFEEIDKKNLTDEEKQKEKDAAMQTINTEFNELISEEKNKIPSDQFAQDLNKAKVAAGSNASALDQLNTLDNSLRQNQEAAQKNLEVLETFSVTQVLKLPGQTAPKFLETVKSGPNNSPIIGIFFWLITFLMRIIGSIAVLISVAGGFVIMVSSGNDQRVEQGKNMIKFSLIGIAVAMSSFIIASFIQSLVVGQ
jgi:hypothetical protein